MNEPCQLKVLGKKEREDQQADPPLLVSTVSMDSHVQDFA